MTAKELQEQAEQARREKGRLLYEIGERHYMKLRSEGRRQESRRSCARSTRIRCLVTDRRDGSRAAQKQCKSCRTTLEPGAKFCGNAVRPSRARTNKRKLNA